MQKQNNHKQKITPLAGVFREVSELPSEVSNALHKAAPHLIEFKPRDVLQVIVGATILAIPVGFTEETWVLSQTMPFTNIITLSGISIFFIALFVYYTYYRHSLKQHFARFLNRTFWTYMLSLSVVAGLLTIIQVTPWSTDALLAFKRVILVAFPASMSAVVADTIK